jgi:hypothetical protein
VVCGVWCGIGFEGCECVNMNKRKKNEKENRKKKNKKYDKEK